MLPPGSLRASSAARVLLLCALSLLLLQLLVVVEVVAVVVFVISLRASTAAIVPAQAKPFGKSSLAIWQTASMQCNIT